MRLTAVTVEVLIAAAATQWPLPHLAQVGVDIAAGIGRPAERVRQRRTATGTVACRRLRATVARPHQPVLLVVAEVLRLAASRATLPGDGGLRQRAADDVAGRVVAGRLREDRPARAAAALPARRQAGRAQITIVAQRLAGDGAARAATAVEGQGVDQVLRVVAQRHQVRHPGGGITQPVEHACRAIIGEAFGVAGAAPHARCGRRGLVGVVIGVAHLVDGDGWDSQAATGDGDLLLLRDESSTMIVLELLRHVTLAVVGAGEGGRRHALRELPDGEIGAALCAQFVQVNNLYVATKERIK